MKICLVSAFPPSRRGLNEYGFHIARELQQDSLSSLIILDDANVRFPRLYRLAGNVATRLLLMANSVSVLLPAYRRTLIEKYRGDNVHFRAHGIFSARPEYPDFTRRGNPEHRILAFGKWGTY